MSSFEFRSPVGGSSNGPTNTVFVTEASDLASIDSSKNYMIDGVVDMGSQSITVPPGGISLSGLNGARDTAKLISSENGFDLFVTDGGSYSGDMVLESLTIEVTGVGSNVFALDNDNNSSAIDIVGVNFSNCTSLGYLTDYRQILFSTCGFIFCDDGLEFNGTWAGLVATDSIVLASGDIDMFKAGVGLTFSGSVRSNVNFLSVGIGSTFMDFSAANILADEGLLIDGFRTTASDAFPNIAPSNVKARFRNSRGIDNTYIGGQWSCTGSATTSIPAVDTPVKLVGTTTYTDMQWFSNSTNNEFVYDGAGNVRVEVNATVPLSGGTGDEINTIIRQWDDSAGSYIDLADSGPVTLSLFGAFASINVHGFASMDTNDRIEMWVENKSDATDVTMQLGGIVSVTER